MRKAVRCTIIYLAFACLVGKALKRMAELATAAMEYDERRQEEGVL